MSGAVQAIQVISALVDLLQTMQRLAPTLSAEMQAVSALVKQAQTDGRDLSDADRVAVMALLGAARDRALVAIARAQQAQASAPIAGQ